jgi:hypothetical protein
LKLKNYFQVGIGAGLLIALVGSIIWIKNGYSSAPVPVVEEAVDPLEAGPDTRLEEDIAARNAAPGLGGVEVSQAKQTVDIEKASLFFAQGIQQATACLALRTEKQDRVEPTYSNVLLALQASFGNPIMQSEDWVVWSLKAGRENRRIRVETDYSDSKATTKNLRYFKIDEQGTPIVIPLPAEQTKNPSEAFIATLQKDGEVFQEEKGLRSYFENGQEMTVTERDGKVDDVEITNGPKTFRCAGILKENPSCKCY